LLRGLQHPPQLADLAVLDQNQLSHVLGLALEGLEHYHPLLATGQPCL
jgi:hypothetical protein